MGEDRSGWKQYDATELLLNSGGPSAFDDILVDVGTADPFLKAGQLLPEVRTVLYHIKACRQVMCIFVHCRRSKRRRST